MDLQAMLMVARDLWRRDRTAGDRTEIVQVYQLRGRTARSDMRYALPNLSDCLADSDDDWFSGGWAARTREIPGAPSLLALFSH